MNTKTKYRLNLFFRLFFIGLGLLTILIGFFIDGIKLFGTTTDKGAFKPIKVGIYKSMMDKRFRYQWKVKFEFFIDKTKYVGSKFFRGGPDDIEFKKEIGYLSVYPKINWLETDEPKGLNFILSFVIGQFLIWFALRKKLIYAHDLSVVVNGVYYANTGILPVKGLSPSKYISFIFESIKNGFERVFSLNVIFIILYLLAIWYLVLWAKTKPEYADLASVLSWLTYAQAGAHGSINDFVGGITGKILLVSFLLYPAIEDKYETNYLICNPTKTLSFYGLLSSFGAFILGFGISLFLFNFMSSGLCREDSIIGLILFLFCYKAQKNINNPIIGFINSFEKGEPLNPNAAKRAMQGASLGFLIGFSVIWTSYIFFIDYLVSSIILALGFSIILISFLFRKDDNSKNGFVNNISIFIIFISLFFYSVPCFARDGQIDIEELIQRKEAEKQNIEKITKTLNQFTDKDKSELTKKLSSFIRNEDDEIEKFDDDSDEINLQYFINIFNDNVIRSKVVTYISKTASYIKNNAETSNSLEPLYSLIPFGFCVFASLIICSISTISGKEASVFPMVIKDAQRDWKSLDEKVNRIEEKKVIPIQVKKYKPASEKNNSNSIDNSLESFYSYDYELWQGIGKQAMVNLQSFSNDQEFKNVYNHYNRKNVVSGHILEDELNETDAAELVLSDLTDKNNSLLTLMIKSRLANRFAGNGQSEVNYMLNQTDLAYISVFSDNYDNSQKADNTNDLWSAHSWV